VTEGALLKKRQSNSPAPRNGDAPTRGFSLVELVIVVVIIGVIAAIAVPRVTAGAAGAGEAALRGSLKTMRDAIDRYAAEHIGDLPGAKPDGQGNGAQSPEAFINQLTMFSDAAGAVSNSGGASYPFGPYFRRIPPLPVGGNAGKAGVAIDAINSPPVVLLVPAGWVYNPSTGEVIANSDDPNRDGSRSFDEF
jgi:prepilin-type N-terminal cleavage/methylation domain-containing protein